MPHLAYYAVLLVDVLGQAEKLRNLKMPRTEEEKKNTLHWLKQTYGVVEGIRRNFDSYLMSLREPRPNPGYPDAAWKALRKWSKPKIGYMGISDTLIFHVDLSTEDGAIPIISLLHLLNAACFVVTSGLSMKIMMRGAIDVGVALNPGNDQIYGHVLSLVHHLENRIAQHPRVLIGDELRDYIDGCRKDSRKEPEALVNVEMARQCNELLTQDPADGLWMLDYLNLMVNPLVRNVGPQLAEDAYKFVMNETERFAGDPKLGPRYQQLLSYFKAKRPTWIHLV